MSQAYVKGWSYVMPKACACGCKTGVYIGIQQGVSFDLHLFNCDACKSSVGVKV